MNVKRWFPWACLAMMLVTDIFLFRAIREKDAATLNLRDTEVQLSQTQDDLDALKNSNVGLQASEILRLRKQNEILTNRFAGLEDSLAEMEAENTSNAQHLATARLAIRLQQQHLQQLESQTEQILLVAATYATNNAAIIAQKTCLSNLRRIDDAKQAWATENSEPDSAVPKEADLLPFLKSGVFPVCPSGGTYSINAVNEVPTCSYPGHVFRQ
jgi:predicted nuclease with TOPRIM domain